MIAENPKIQTLMLELLEIKPCLIVSAITIEQIKEINSIQTKKVVVS
jgi:hypothetical protein